MDFSWLHFVPFDWGMQDSVRPVTVKIKRIDNPCCDTQTKPVCKTFVCFVCFVFDFSHALQSNPTSSLPEPPSLSVMELPGSFLYDSEQQQVWVCSICTRPQPDWGGIWCHHPAPKRSLPDWYSYLPQTRWHLYSLHQPQSKQNSTKSKSTVITSKL